jgi:predicted nucleotidyltransferase
MPLSGKRMENYKSDNVLQFSSDTLPSSLPEPHREFLLQSIDRLKTDHRVVGIAAGGSFVTNSMDEFSDLDLIIAVEPTHYAEIMAERMTVAASLGKLLAAFSGEHVGEPRVLICLFEAPLLHVDLKFVSLEDVATRVEDPCVLWERDGRLSSALVRGKAEFPTRSPQWIEDRFWIWVHYAATRIARGELFEAIDFLSFLRGTVLGPLALARAGARPSGVRKIETIAPAFALQLRHTIAIHDAADCLRGLRACAELYRSLKPRASSERVEDAAMEYLAEVERRYGHGPLEK